MQKRSILLVEDEEGTAYLVKRALSDLDPSVSVNWLQDVDRSVRYLLNPDQLAPGQKEEGRLPGLILLDINLPPKSGYDVLEVVQTTMALKHIPVVMFSSAESPGDQAISLSRGASAHFGKPTSYKGYLRTLGKVLDLMAESRCEQQPSRAYPAWVLTRCSAFITTLHI
jgi:two-component system, chemotaxis family, response regulator Rcp1